MKTSLNFVIGMVALATATPVSADSANATGRNFGEISWGEKFCHGKRTATAERVRGKHLQVDDPEGRDFKSGVEDGFRNMTDMAAAIGVDDACKEIKRMYGSGGTIRANLWRPDPAQ